MRDVEEFVDFGQAEASAQFQDALRLQAEPAGDPLAAEQPVDNVEVGARSGCCIFLGLN